MHDGTKRLLLAAACIVVAILLYWLTKPQPRREPPAETSSATEAARNPSAPQVPATPTPAKPQAPSAPSASAEGANQPSAVAPSPSAVSQVPASDPDGPPPAADPVAALPADPAQDLDGVQTMMRDFRTVLGENPVGTNAEITSALLGDNLKQVKIPVPAGSSVNGNGELVDRWGTPYFFHQLSAKEMEIRSAGPDRKMWTGDDRQVQ